MEQYLFLASDLDALQRRIARYEQEWRETLAGVHESTTQSSETWHDNPQFDDVQQRAQMLETERKKLAAILDASLLVEPPPTHDRRVHVGSTVHIRYAKTGGEDRFVIGSYMVLDNDDGHRISYAAPLAKLLLGHAQGETVEGTIGTREMKIEIIKVGSADQPVDAE